MAGLVVSCRSAQMLTNKYEKSPYFQLLFSKTPRQAPCLPCLWPFVAFPCISHSNSQVLFDTAVIDSRVPAPSLLPLELGIFRLSKIPLSTGIAWYRLVSLGLWPWSWCDDGARVGIVLTNFRGGATRCGKMLKSPNWISCLGVRCPGIEGCWLGDAPAPIK